MDQNIQEQEQANKKLYIEMSKTDIDNAINSNNYQQAFFRLIMVLERLDNDEKIEFIDYYSKVIFNLKGKEYALPLENYSLYKFYTSNKFSKL